MRTFLNCRRWLITLFIMLTMLSLPAKVLALDLNLSFLNSLYTKINNSINKTAGAINTGASKIGDINIRVLTSYALNAEALKSEIRPFKIKVRHKIKTSYSEAIISIYNLERKVEQQLVPLKSKVPLLNLKKEPSSRLIVKSGDFKYFENLLNSLSSKQYDIDEKGYVHWNSSVPEDLSKSQEYSIVIDNLIKANHTTYIYNLPNSSKGYQIYVPLKGSVVLNGDQANYIYNVISLPNTGLSHELTHSLRLDKGVFSANISEEEAGTIKLENIIRHKNNIAIRVDGSKYDDVNKDGQPDGLGYYGEYLDKNNSNWFNDLFGEKSLLLTK